ncbi:MAG: hypothetical protein RPU34_11295 [Candidatus Sedimenticola sp. (ex Thyasira tokunagai)]
MAELTHNPLTCHPGPTSRRTDDQNPPTVYFNLPLRSTQKAPQPVYGLHLIQAGIDARGVLCR